MQKAKWREKATKPSEKKQMQHSSALALCTYDTAHGSCVCRYVHFFIGFCNLVTFLCLNPWNRQLTLRVLQCRDVPRRQEYQQVAYGKINPVFSSVGLDRHRRGRGGVEVTEDMGIDYFKDMLLLKHTGIVARGGWSLIYHVSFENIVFARCSWRQHSRYTDTHTITEYFCESFCLEWRGAERKGTGCLWLYFDLFVYVFVFLAKSQENDSCFFFFPSFFFFERLCNIWTAFLCPFCVVFVFQSEYGRGWRECSPLGAQMLGWVGGGGGLAGKLVFTRHAMRYL